MRRISTTTRISICLATLAVGVLLAADVIGLIPDEAGATLRGRVALCEAVALQSSSSMIRGDAAAVSSAIDAVARRNPDILSAAIRHADGSILLQVGDHATHWKAPPGDTSTITHVRVPIFENRKLWAHVEIAFRPLDSSGWTLIRHPLIRLTLFVAIAAFATFLSYLRKVLQYLDPSVVIPERVKAMLDTLAEGVLIIDRQERILLANRALAKATGKQAGDLIGTHLATFGWRPPPTEGAPAETPAAQFPWREALKDGRVRTGVPLCLERLDGVRTFTVNAAPIGTESEVRGALVTFDDVTSIEQRNLQLRGMLQMLQKSRDEINRQNQELQALAMTDPLTACLNRRAFFSHFETQWSSARRYGYPLACVMVDVDHFKRINDVHGHATGDRVLQHIAAVLKSLIRDSDLVCRYGGEEFCILLPHTDGEGAAQCAERFRNAIETTACGMITMTASLGVATLSAGAISPQDLLNQADEALYAAKRAGRNRVNRWTAADHAAQADASEPAGIRSDGAAAGHSPEDQATAAAIPFRAVTALMSVLAHRDKATAAHSQRVADLCVAVASGMLKSADCFVLEVAGLLHDIGKLGVPDSVLLKPGPLDDDEWAVMRKHDRMGAEIIQSAFGSEELTRIVRSHHLCYGGAPESPAVPSHDDIPLAARILTVCDAYDAMVSDRPYRKGRTPEEGFAELRRCAGTQFDPELVERLIRVVITRQRSHAARPPTPVEVETIAGIQRELERLANALELRDLSLLSAVAGRLAASAQHDGLPQVAQLAGELEKSASTDPDLADIVDKINELMTLCVIPRAAAAEKASEGAKREGASQGA
jgi:diguanylate cyclase (GGDEF)-like protein/putative nucleotidyltransferase with HDIG domain/PAS domain S-box-containing protein